MFGPGAALRRRRDQFWFHKGPRVTPLLFFFPSAGVTGSAQTGSVRPSDTAEVLFLLAMLISASVKTLAKKHLGITSGAAQNALK